MPGDFVRSAEETGLIRPICRRVLEEACRQGAFWRKSTQRDLSMTADLSAIQIYDPGFGLESSGILMRTNVPEMPFTLELTESACADQESIEPVAQRQRAGKPRSEHSLHCTDACAHRRRPSGGNASTAQGVVEPGLQGFYMGRPCEPDAIEPRLLAGLRADNGGWRAEANAPSLVTHSGPLATIGCKPRQAQKGATVAGRSCAEVWLAWDATRSAAITQNARRPGCC